ncbi:heterodisulfide reductase-related iron-sulfur binding cluster [Nocardioides sp. DS6]|uniref:Heterodisulfide reductase-related iron-sulfur binding cluster n=1 Tax=Nocardioides eburneus TaxID=3231482 RepID=A0ABV3T1U9_9ACTN
MLQTIVIAVSLALAVVTVYLVVQAVRSMVGVLRIGQPASRADAPGKRTLTMLKETFLHTRMFQWRWVGVMHWFVYFGFLILSTAVLQGIFQLFDPSFALPLIGRWFVYEWVCEAIGVLSTIGIVFLIVYRQMHLPKREGRRSRFFGSTFWQAYFVEAMALLEGAAIIFIRGAEYGLDKAEGHTDSATRFHFPISSYVGEWLHYPLGKDGLETLVLVIAFIKVVSALAWLDVVALNLTMGIAWHRFTAWFNIWFKREANGRDTDGATTALGSIKPLTSNGKAITLDDIDDLDEDAKLGVGSIEDFSWKGILDFTTCTECGRCQSQCPAWNTEKPLSPKHLVMSLREHAYAAAPYLQSGRTEGTVAEKPLIGHTDQDSAAGAGEEVLDWFYNPADGGFVIDEDVLWSCTSCGACVQQCPVDIEHVDHIMDMRRYQVLVESNFPTELNGLFRGLENNGNPWNMSSRARMDWAKDLPFDVKVVGEDIESLDEVDWLFWVGCAGAYEDRAKKTTRAVAELLDLAGISFGVLGNGETCTGDSARRAGNEFVFQGLAQQNVETFKEFKVKKAVTTCAHCFNTLKNEYKEFGIELKVVHHTQLLNRLVREGKLTPVASGAGAHKRSITYHDPCYIGRHNGVYTPPRELLQVLPGASVVEMPRNSERSFCCGAGGARMWMEENLGSRINRNRTDEAVATGADQIAVGCPFCRVMLSDGLTAAQSDGTAREEVEVLDVAQMLLASVKGEMATKLAPGSGTETAAKVATAAEPSAGDVTASAATVTETADAGPAAKASQEAGGSSLFDTPAQGTTSAPDDASSLFDTPAPAEPAAPESKATPSSGGSLFDEGGSLFDTPAEQAPAAEEKPATAPEPEADQGTGAASGSDAGLGGGSLFDIPATPATPAAEAAAPTAEPTPTEPAAPAEPAAEEPQLGAGGSLFDIPATPAAEAAAPVTPEATDVEQPSASATAPVSTEKASEPEATETAKTAPPAGSGATSAPRSDVDIEGASSLFDIEAPDGAVAAAPAAPTPAGPAPASAAQQAGAAQTADASAPVEAPVTDATAAGAQQDEAEQSSASPAAPTSTETAPTAPATPVVSTTAVASSGVASAPRSDVEIDSVSSLFDIEAPEGTVVAGAPAAAAAEVPAAEVAAEAAPEASAAETAAEEQAAVVEASQPEASQPEASQPEASEHATETSPAAPTEAETEDSSEAPAVEQPELADDQAAPQSTTSSGESHAPRTDVDIHEVESLFDL